MLWLIAALGTNRAIGRGGKLLWRIPGDLPRFKRLTTGHPVVMGRKTFDAIGKPLPGRTNLVVSRTLASAPVDVVRDLDAALRTARAAPGGDEIFVIGGGEIYAQAIARADRLALTLVDDRPDADTFFPAYDDFTHVVEETRFTDATPPHRFVILERS